MTPRRAGHIAVRPEWLALHREDILDPDLPIIDAHHHIYDRPDNRYLPPQLIEDVSGRHCINATVFIECRTGYRPDGDELMQPVGEVEYIARVAETATGSARICAAIVGYAELHAGERVAEVLEAQIEAGKGRFRGVRNISAWHPDPAARGSVAEPLPDLYNRQSFREGFTRLAPLGLSFDAWLYHTQIDELVELAQLNPSTPIVLNHLGGPIGIGPYAARRTDVFNEWRAAMGRLARCENVSIKIGGFGMRLFGFGHHEGVKPPDSVTLAFTWRPYVETSVDIFGADRSCSRATFRSTREPFPTRCYGTPSSGSQHPTQLRNGRRYFPDQPRDFTRSNPLHPPKIEPQTLPSRAHANAETLAA